MATWEMTTRDELIDAIKNGRDIVVKPKLLNEYALSKTDEGSIYISCLNVFPEIILVRISKSRLISFIADFPQLSNAVEILVKFFESVARNEIIPDACYSFLFIEAIVMVN